MSVCVWVGGVCKSHFMRTPAFKPPPTRQPPPGVTFMKPSQPHANTQVDAVVVVSTRDAAEQRRRVCARPGMTEDKLDAILARQVPDEDKCRRADHVVDTGCSLEETEAAVVTLIQQLITRD